MVVLHGNSVSDKIFQAQTHSRNPPEGTKLNELDKKKRPGNSPMSERFGPNFAPGSFALQQSERLVYTLRALARGRNRAIRATRDNQDAHTHKRAHTRSATETQHSSQPETMKGSWPLLLPRRRRCCCCATTVLLLLHDPRCIAEHKPSQQTVSRFVFFGTHAEASNGTGAAAAAAAVAVAAAAAQQVHQQGKPKHMYEYIYFFILRRMGKNKA